MDGADSGGLTRRSFVEGAAKGTLALSFAGVLAACSGDETAQPVTTGAVDQGKPTYGGRLRVADVGGGQNESFNPAREGTYIGDSRLHNIYDRLVRVAPDLSIEPGLALEWIPNSDSTVWEIKLRPDVTWHDGKSFTAADVVYSLQSMGDPEHVASIRGIRFDDLTAVDDLTVQVPLESPNARLYDLFAKNATSIIQDGTTDFTNPVGTGPFQFESFTPGQRSLMTRNPNYWDQGKPYADELENISIDDNNARLNALLAGEVDMMGQLPYQQAKAQQAQGQIQVLVGESPAPQMFLMRVDREPFTDVRVRQAMRLIANRQALIDGALAGFGTVANDLVGAGLPYFAEDIPPREQDIEQAKALLKQAGREDLRVTLHTSEIVTGFVEAATLLAEQAKDAGVTIDIKKEPANAYFDSSLLYTKLDFAQSNWIIASLAQFYTQALLSDAVWNETHWRDEAFDKLVQDAQAATDDETATELWRQAQQVQFDQGGYIVWSNTNNVDGLANNVRGLLPSSFGSLGGWNYQDVWLA